MSPVRLRMARGFTLVESLIALLVLSAGMLGAWGLQLSSLRSHGDSLQQAAAMELLRDMADRIRANYSAGARYTDTHLAPPAAGCTSAAPCSPAELAALDRAWFAERALVLFPHEDTLAGVEFVPATGPADPDDFVVSLQWRGARGSHAVALHVPVPPVAG